MVSRISIIAVTTLLAAWAVACGGETPSDTAPAVQAEVTGVILDVIVGSLTQTETFSMQDDSGATWDFNAEDYQGWLPSPLRDHMVQAYPVTVTYHEEAGVLMVDEIADAGPGD